MDRPINASVLDKNANLEYVQPQYLVDCLNNQFLLPTSQYRPGTPPPAHLSPFIDNEKEGYVPMRQKEIAHLKGEEVVDSSSDEEEEVETKPEKSNKNDKTDKNDEEMGDGKGDADSSSEEEESSEEQNLDQLRDAKKKFNAKLKKDTEIE